MLLLKTNTVILAAVTIALVLACNRKDPRLEEARLRILDSIREADVTDSMERASVHNMLIHRLKILQLPQLDSLGPDDALRMTVEFSWGGPQEVGPWLSMLAFREGDGYKLSVTGFPGRKRTEMANRDLDEDEYLKLNALLDSASFENISRFEHVDYVSTDPDRYFIERRRNGKYYAISRSSFVDVFIYKLFGDAATTAGMPQVLINRFREDEMRAAEKLQK